VATRLPYYTGNDDIYSQLMRQFETELPYYSAPVMSGGGYDPTLYYRQLSQDYGAGLLGDSGMGMSTGGSDGGITSSSNGSSSMGGGLLGALGLGGSGVSSNGSVSTGFGGVSLSPEGVVTANTVSVPAAMGLGLITGMPLGLIANMTNQSANAAAQGLTSSLADTMGVNALSGPAATAGSSGTGGAAAAASAAAAAAAAAAGLSSEAQGAAGQAAADAVVSGASSAEAAAAGAAAAAAAGMGAEGNSGDAGAAVADASAAGTAADAAASASDVAAASGGDGGGGAGGKIICTKLHELGKMPSEIYEADQAFGAILVQESPETYHGYACWAQTVVRWMSRDDWFGKFVIFAAYHIATPWSKAMAQEMGVKVESGWFGRFLMKHGLKVCRAIGKMNQDRSVQNV
jgi:hypothetical protein